MCLAVPVQVIDIDIESSIAKVEVEGVKVKVSTSLFPQAKVGDFVLVHAGFIIERVPDDEASKMLEAIKEATINGNN